MGNPKPENIQFNYKVPKEVAKRLRAEADRRKCRVGDLLEFFAGLLPEDLTEEPLIYSVNLPSLCRALKAHAILSGQSPKEWLREFVESQLFDELADTIKFAEELQERPP